MPEKGQTIFAADQVGFTRMRKSDLMHGPVPILEKDATYAFVFADGLRTIVVPINDQTRKDLIQSMRTLPLTPAVQANGH